MTVRDVPLYCHNRLVQKTLKYGNTKKHDLTREDVLELFDELKI